MSVELCSVVVPVYNGATHVRETIESFLLQDYPEKELILVDDASEDESLQLLEAYQREYPDSIQVLKQTENQGVVQTVIHGTVLSRGTYVSVVGQDDVMFGGRISTLVDAIRCQNVSMVCSNAYYLYGDEPSKDLVNLRWRSDRCIEKHMFLTRNPVIGSSVLFRKAAFFDIDMSLFTEFRNCMEWLHWFQYACMNGVYYLAAPLLYYRRHERNLSNTIFTTPEYHRYRRFCKRHVRSRLTVKEIALALANDISMKLRERL